MGKSFSKSESKTFHKRRKPNTKHGADYDFIENTEIPSQDRIQPSICPKEGIGTHRRHAILKRIEFEEKIAIFKSLIEKNLIVRHILPHLQFLDHEEILSTERRSNTEAVGLLLNKIKSYKEVEKWHTFIDVLDTCGYEYIVKTLRGYNFINHLYQEEYIKNVAPRLNKILNPLVLLPGLHAADVISQNDREEIEREYTNLGSTASANMLLSRLSKRSTNWYTQFITVLRQEESHEIADMLDIPELTKHKVIKHSSVGDRPELPPRIHVHDTINATPQVRVHKTLYATAQNSVEKKSESMYIDSGKYFGQKFNLEDLSNESQNLSEEINHIESAIVLQTDINEKLKRRKELLHEMDIKTKEAAAIEDPSPVIITYDYVDHIDCKL